MWSPGSSPKATCQPSLSVHGYKAGATGSDPTLDLDAESAAEPVTGDTMRRQGEPGEESVPHLGVDRNDDVSQNPCSGQRDAGSNSEFTVRSPTSDSAIRALGEVHSHSSTHSRDDLGICASSLVQGDCTSGTPVTAESLDAALGLTLMLNDTAPEYAAVDLEHSAAWADVSAPPPVDQATADGDQTSPARCGSLLQHMELGNLPRASQGAIVPEDLMACRVHSEIRHVNSQILYFTFPSCVVLVFLQHVHEVQDI